MPAFGPPPELLGPMFWDSAERDRWSSGLICTQFQSIAVGSNAASALMFSILTSDLMRLLL